MLSEWGAAVPALKAAAEAVVAAVEVVTAEGTLLARARCSEAVAVPVTKAEAVHKSGN